MESQLLFKESKSLLIIDLIEEIDSYRRLVTTQLFIGMFKNCDYSSFTCNRHSYFSERSHYLVH